MIENSIGGEATLDSWPGSAEEVTLEAILMLAREASCGQSEELVRGPTAGGACSRNTKGVAWLGQSKGEEQEQEMSLARQS